MNAKRILITGASGQLGLALQGALDGHTLLPRGRNELDVTERDAVFMSIAGARPDLVIHCAAYTNVDGCARDPARAYRVNGLGSQNVALACQKFGSDLVHISTNEVFAGDEQDGYEEWMPLNPANPYGRSKAAAEVHVRNLLNRYYLVRTAWLYASGGHNFIHKIMDRARRDGHLRVVDDEIGNPTYVQDLATAIGLLIETGQYGIYHLVNEGTCSRWTFANEILRLAGLAHVENEPIKGAEFDRASSPPPFGILHNLAAAALGIRLRSWQEALADYVRAHVTGAQPR